MLYCLMRVRGGLFVLQRIEKAGAFLVANSGFFFWRFRRRRIRRKKLSFSPPLSLSHTPLPTSSPATAANQSQRRGGAASPSSSSSRAQNSVLLRATTEAATASDPTVSLAAASPPSFDPASAPYRSRAAKDVRVLVVGRAGRDRRGRALLRRRREGRRRGLGEQRGPRGQGAARSGD